jgi:hypothetical protein
VRYIKCVEILIREVEGEREISKGVEQLSK